MFVLRAGTRTARDERHAVPISVSDAEMLIVNTFYGDSGGGVESARAA